MSSTNNPQPAFAREAAVLNLGKLLATKKRGDRITAAEIQDATGFADWRSFRGRIFTWAKNNGLAPFAVTNDGWRFGMPAEHIDFAERKRKTAKGHEKRGLQALLDIPRPELDDEQERRLIVVIPRAAQRVAEAESHDRAIRTEFKQLADRNPHPHARLTSG